MSENLWLFVQGCFALIAVLIILYLICGVKEKYKKDEDKVKVLPQKPTFPISPKPEDTFTDLNGVIWIYSGLAWMHYTPKFPETPRQGQFFEYYCLGIRSLYKFDGQGKWNCVIEDMDKPLVFAKKEISDDYVKVSEDGIHVEVNGDSWNMSGTVLKEVIVKQIQSSEQYRIERLIQNHEESRRSAKIIADIILTNLKNSMLSGKFGINNGNITYMSEFDSPADSDDFDNQPFNDSFQAELYRNVTEGLRGTVWTEIGIRASGKHSRPTYEVAMRINFDGKHTGDPIFTIR